MLQALYNADILKEELSSFPCFWTSWIGFIHIHFILLEHPNHLVILDCRSITISKAFISLWNGCSILKPLQTGTGSDTQGLNYGGTHWKEKIHICLSALRKIEAYRMKWGCRNIQPLKAIHFLKHFLRTLFVSRTFRTLGVHWQINFRQRQ